LRSISILIGAAESVFLFFQKKAMEKIVNSYFSEIKKKVVEA